MPTAAPKPCTRCGALSDESRCPEHRSQFKRGRNPTQSRQARGYGADWVKKSREYRERHPNCRACGAPSQCVDHIVPIRSGGARLDEKNLQALCNRCHSLKTLKHDGGFGNDTSWSGEHLEPELEPNPFAR